MPKNGIVTEDTFDLIMVQFYEGFSHMLYSTKYEGISASDYLYQIVKKFDQGWLVDFSQIGLGAGNITIKHSKLIIGLANGWAADNSKFIFIEPAQLKRANDLLNADQIAPRGFGFWNILDEGKLVDRKPFYLALELCKILGASKTDLLHIQ